MDGKHKYEYDHYILGPDIHYGRHSAFGRHVAIGQGNNTVHLYPNRIYIGGKKGTSLSLTPEQTLVMSRILNKMGQRAQGDQLLEHISGDDDATT